MVTISRNEIVLNKMFCGSYLDQNIGHEIINLYKDDCGENYIYIQPYGTYSTCHYGTIKYVLLTRSVEGRFALEVLGVALIDRDIFDPSLPKQKTRIQQQELCEHIEYGGENLNMIFSPNEKNIHQDVYVTLHAQYMMRPARKVYLVFGGENNESNLRNIVGNTSIIVSMNSNYAKSSMKQYFVPGNDDYDQLTGLINTVSLWTIDTEQINIADEDNAREENFFDICRIDDYELAFSNALAFYMTKYPEMVVEFAKDYLGVTTQPFESIQREYKNIDLYLKNNESFVVIENKITSKINGIEVSDNKSAANQLYKYYKIASGESKGRFEVKCYLLTPDYNRINLGDYNLPGFDCLKIYRTILYSQVYEYLVGKIQQEKYADDAYLKEFVKGLRKHAQLYHDDLFADTKERFINQLKGLKAAKRIN